MRRNKGGWQMIGEPIDSSFLGSLRDGDAMVEDGKVFELKKLGGTAEKDFEDDIEALMRAAGWVTYTTNAQAQADYDRNGNPGPKRS
jgi:hypothetical protein